MAINNWQPGNFVLGMYMISFWYYHFGNQSVQTVRILHLNKMTGIIPFDKMVAGSYGFEPFNILIGPK